MNCVYLKNPSFKSIAEYLKAKCSGKTALGDVDFPKAFTLPCFLEFCEASQMNEWGTEVKGPGATGDMEQMGKLRFGGDPGVAQGQS